MMGIVYHANYLLYFEDARTRIVSSRPTKTVYAYEVFKQGQDLDTAKPCCTGRSTHCLVDAKTFKPVSVKRAVPELYARYEEVLEPEDDGAKTSDRASAARR